MIQVEVGQFIPRDGDEFFKWEQASFAYWATLSEQEKKELVATVQSELQRLASTVENWLPAGMKQTSSHIEVLMRIYPDDVAEHMEITEEEIAAAMTSLADILSD